jgi:hypothetical protein
LKKSMESRLLDNKYADLAASARVLLKTLWSEDIT